MIEMMGYGIIGFILFICAWFAGVSVVYFIIQELKNGFDYTFRPIHKFDAEITGKFYVPGYTGAAPILNAYTVVPMIKYTPPSFTLSIETDKGSTLVEVSPTVYDVIQNGEWLKVEYKIGRFSEKVKIFSIIKNGIVVY